MVFNNMLIQNSLISHRPSLTDGTDEGGSKTNCCHGGLPWWFIFFGWLLVMATSVVAGYFTMIYGLKFGKERSISWLISMVVSFFQSILVIQPLKVQRREEFYTQEKACNLKLVMLSSQVVFLAIFFALVIKKVDEEDYQHMVVENDSHPGSRSWKCLFQGLIFEFSCWIGLQKSWFLCRWTQGSTDGQTGQRSVSASCSSRHWENEKEQYPRTESLCLSEGVSESVFFCIFILE